MLARYRSQDWPGARAALALARSRDPGLGPADLYDLYEARIERLTAEPLGAD